MKKLYIYQRGSGKTITSVVMWLGQLYNENQISKKDYIEAIAFIKMMWYHEPIIEVYKWKNEQMRGELYEI